LRGTDGRRDEAVNAYQNACDNDQGDEPEECANGLVALYPGFFVEIVGHASSAFVPHLEQILRGV
jgi:hypothetical protein